MNRLLHNMVCLALGLILPMLMALDPAKAQSVVYQGKTTPLEVVPVTGHSYTWELYNDSTVNFAAVTGNCPVTSAAFTGGNSGSKVNVIWLQPGIYFYKVTARDDKGCTMNLKIGMFKVLPPKIDAVISGETLIGECQQVKLDASKSTGLNLKYEWSILDQGGAITNSTGVTTEFLLSPSYSGSLPANFRIRLRVTDNVGNSDSDTIRIKIDPLPIASIFSNGRIQSDGSMIVDGSGSIGTGLTYKWSTSEGKIIGSANKPTANLLGAGSYNLEITDIHGCKSIKTFRFPVELFQVNAKPDYARTSWAEDTTITVLANDESTASLNPGSVHVIKQPSRGETKVNPDGTITYTPAGRNSGRDEFVYEVCDIMNICASALVTIDIYQVSLKVPEGLSPNGDGLNDKFEVKGLESYPNSHLSVYTRSGQLIYESSNYQNDWDGRTLLKGTSHHELVPTGVYYYILELGGVNHNIKGFIYIAY